MIAIDKHIISIVAPIEIKEEPERAIAKKPKLMEAKSNPVVFIFFHPKISFSIIDKMNK
jgi:hypothetical protein